jgi:hypothetical protein
MEMKVLINKLATHEEEICTNEISNGILLYRSLADAVQKQSLRTFLDEIS